MKNVHILPTDKPSRLYSYKSNLFLTTESHLNVPSMKYQNIYITSDEVPKLNEWGINTKNNIVFKCKGFTVDAYDKKHCKKIILTTDQDLIKDGVQAIPDEFLQWFVKNPSCEEIDIDVFDVDYGSHNKNSYEIIIPKVVHQNKGFGGGIKKGTINMVIGNPKQGSMSEAVKQAITDIMKSDEELGLYEPELDDLNPYIGPFLLRNGFSKRQSSNNIYYNLECIVTILDDCYEINFHDPQCGEVTMYTDSWSIMHLVGLLTWYDLIEKNYKK